MQPLTRLVPLLHFNCQYIANRYAYVRVCGCVCVCVCVCVKEFFHHYQCPCCGCHMPLNANAARSTFACCRWFLRLQLLLSLLLLPFVAPQLHATPTENGSERERRLGHYIQAFLCGISWHFSVRRQLLPVSVTVSVTHFHSSSHLSLSLSLLSLCFVCFSRAQNVPTFCY